MGNEEEPTAEAVVLEIEDTDEFHGEGLGEVTEGELGDDLKEVFS